MNRSAWRKSSFSAANNACVELARGLDQTAVRDSKRPAAGQLRFPSSSFAVFLRRVA